MNPLRIVSVCAAVSGFTLGGVLTCFLLASRDIEWEWVSNWTSTEWVFVSLMSAFSLALAALWSVFAWRALVAEPFLGWVLPVGLASWWLTWWLIPGNLVLVNIVTAESTPAPALVPDDFLVWVSGSLVGAITGLLTLVIWMWRLVDRRRVSRSDEAQAGAAPSGKL